jgi:hypothetical protein
MGVQKGAQKIMSFHLRRQMNLFSASRLAQNRLAVSAIVGKPGTGVTSSSVRTGITPGTPGNRSSDSEPMVTTKVTRFEAPRALDGHA